MCLAEHVLEVCMVLVVMRCSVCSMCMLDRRHRLSVLTYTEDEYTTNRTNADVEYTQDEQELVYKYYTTLGSPPSTQNLI